MRQAHKVRGACSAFGAAPCCCAAARQLAAEAACSRRGQTDIGQREYGQKDDLVHGALVLALLLCGVCFETLNRSLARLFSAPICGAAKGGLCLGKFIAGALYSRNTRRLFAQTKNLPISRSAPAKTLTAAAFSLIFLPSVCCSCCCCLFSCCMLLGWCCCTLSLRRAQLPSALFRLVRNLRQAGLSCLLPRCCCCCCFC